MKTTKPDRYILKDRKPVSEPDLMKWGVWLQNMDNTRVDFTKVSKKIEVSTVFLGLNHNWGDGAPILFETMVFKNGDSRGMWRYATWDEAVAGHKKVVEELSNPKGG